MSTGKLLPCVCGEIPMVSVESDFLGGGDRVVIRCDCGSGVVQEGATGVTDEIALRWNRLGRDEGDESYEDARDPGFGYRTGMFDPPFDERRES